MGKWKSIKILESTYLKIPQNQNIGKFIDKAVDKFRRENEEIKQLKAQIETLNNGGSEVNDGELVKLRLENETLRLENETLRMLEEKHNADSIEESSKCDYFTIGEKLGTVFCGKDWRFKGKIYTVPLSFCRRCGDWTQTAEEDGEEN